MKTNQLHFVLFILVCLVMALPAALFAQQTQYGVVATVAADWTSGAHSIIHVDPAGGPREVANNLTPTVSDVSVAAYKEYFYRIERMNADNVTKFHVSDPGTPIWQFSTLDDPGEITGNPQDIVFADETKAYLFRYGKTTAWIINPSAATEEEFKTGELDLASYADEDGLPEMKTGVIAKGKLFVVLQRINRNNNWMPGKAYLAVFDLATDTELETGYDMTDPVFGIPLPVKNPTSIQFLEETNQVYVQGAGQYEASWSGIPAEYSGGIISVDADTFAMQMIINDGDQISHPYGQISGMLVVSATSGYFVGYAGWGDNTLYHFNPETKEVYGPANAYLEHTEIAGLEAGAFRDKNGMIWVCNAGEGEIVILDPETNEIDEIVNTDLNPQDIAFASTGENQQDSPKGDGGGDSGGCFITEAGAPGGNTHTIYIIFLFSGVVLLFVRMRRG